MVMVATDGHRLAKIALDNTKLRGIADDLIVPPKALNAVVKLITDDDKEIGLVFGNKNIMFRELFIIPAVILEKIRWTEESVILMFVFIIGIVHVSSVL